nr:Membrane protein involved in colicin uptake [Kibdelosporangium sp. MJ126-NF4]CTQ98327.1 Membrane protein involved in colicin uptake [Kibdelosporangium sp. MJ126-NF4]
MTALTAGASAGLTATATSAIRDSYEGLRGAVRRRLAARSEEDAQVLDASETEPEQWQPRLGEVLAASGVDRDEEVLAAARTLLEQLEAAGQQPRVNVVDARGAKGAQIGDHNTQTNTFT